MSPRDFLLIGAALSLWGSGFAIAWAWQGARADARVLAIENQHQQDQLALADLWREEVERLKALADEIDLAAAARERTAAEKLKETQHALKTATTGRACLGGAALRLLDQSTGLRPPAGAMYPGALSDRSAAAAAHPTDGADSEATDTDVAGWIAIAGDYYERCRERIRDIRRFDGGER